MGRMDGSLCFHPAGLRSSGQQSWHMLAVTVAVLVGLCQRATAQVFTRDMGSLMDKCPSAWSFTANSPCAYFDPNPLAFRYYAQYYFTIPANAQFDISIQVQSVTGDVDVRLLGPSGVPIASSSERIGEDVIAIQRTALQGAPGNYTLIVQAVGGTTSTYQITIQGSTITPRLAASEVALMKSIISQCCASDDDFLPDSCTRLKRATAVNATAADDLCWQPPTLCDAQGRLVKLVLSGGDKGNFICPSFPKELGQLASLQMLDFSHNGQVGTLADVASVLSPLAGKLKKLYLNNNAFSGPLDCSLVASGLELLWLDTNVLEGPVPACYFASTALQQLSVSDNLLSGPLPPIPAGCALVELDVSANGPPLGPTAVNPGITGTIPATLSNAKFLRILDLSSNNLTGTIPALPSSIQVLQASHNWLSGPVPASLSGARDLRVLDLSDNLLTGSLPSDVTTQDLLITLRLANNRLQGVLPIGGWGEFLADVDLSNNNFEGSYTNLWTHPSIISLNLAYNNLTLDFQHLSLGLGARPDNALMYFNVSHNMMFGQLQDGIGQMRLFKELQEETDGIMSVRPPNPAFDISYNVIYSPFPTWMMPLLSKLFWRSPLPDSIPMEVVLHPQRGYPFRAPGGTVPQLTCPGIDQRISEVAYQQELQTQYNLTCTTEFGIQVNISRYNDASVRPAEPPRPPLAPSPPPSPPPRPPRRRGPQSAAPAVETPAGSDPAAQGGDGQQPSGSGDGQSPSLNAASPPPPLGSVDGGGAPAGGDNLQKGGDGGGGGKKSNGGAIGGAVAGVLIGVIVIAAGVWYYMRRRKMSKYAASRRVPLTHNASYEPSQSTGTVSNFGDLQMFEFKASERPARHRARLP